MAINVFTAIKVLIAVIAFTAINVLIAVNVFIAACLNGY